VVAKSDGPGRGSVFVVRLPTAPLRPSAEKAPAAEAPSFPVSHAFESPPELRGLRVLVVDDEPDTRGLLHFVIGQCEARVTTASSVREALGAIESGTFDVIVSDVGMPDEDGHSLIRKVRALPPSRGGLTPALALTAYARGEDRTAAFRAGFDMHLAKPIDPTELLAVIARLVSRNGDRGSDARDAGGP
jgi:CheY-like chemotaxis protein